MSDYSFMLPWPPSVNGYWRAVNGRQIISKRGREYRKNVNLIMEGIKLSGEQVNSRLSVTLLLEPPTLRKYDVDNFCKGVFDALTDCEFWTDDEIVDVLTIKKCAKRKGGNVTIKIEVIE